MVVRRFRRSRWPARQAGRIRPAAAALGVLALAAGLCAASPAQAATAPAGVWSPFRLPAARSVPGHSIPRHLTRPVPHVHEPAGRAAREYRPAAPAWPAAGTATVRLAGVTLASPLAGLTHAQRPAVLAPRPARAGRLPVTVTAGPVPAALLRAAKTVTGRPVAAPRAAGGTSTQAQAPAAVRIRLAGHAAARAAGVSGAVLTVARADGVGTAGPVSVTVDYAAMAKNYGGGWASRLRLVELPGCALTTPGRQACRRQTPLPGLNEAASQQVTATVPATAAGTVVAATADPAGDGGTYAATSLKPAGTWAAQQGDFSYSYPVDVPPALGGTAPDVTLSYDSQSIDGETSGQNTQASWIGDGWDYSPGFIEMSYEPCTQAGIAKSGDECWGGYDAAISLDGHSSVLVRDSAGHWHPQDDDGSSVQELTNAANGLWDGQYWLVTTTDGTKYYFGMNHLPGGSGTDTATNSAWGVPVYNPSSGDPCYSTTSGQSSWCQMGYRWNLDYVVDPDGNLTTYDYSAETNYYERGGGQGSGTLTSYVRAGYPVSISYGYQLSDAIAGAQPAAQVLFGTSQRCLTSSTFTNCGYSNLSSSTASNWPDVPYDQNCGSSGSCTVDSPTFWSTVRLTSITTQVLEGSSYQEADSYALDQSFPDAGGASRPVMFLDSITRTGEDGTAVSLPPETFTPTEIDNRVDGLVPAAEPLYRPRIADIATEYGASIAVTYAVPACSRVNDTMPAAAAGNTMPCFPVYWTPAGESAPILDWFNKSLVTQVAESDETGAGSPQQVTNYSYLGGAAWHQDESPLTPSSYRTWDQYRGYAQVETTSGAAPDPVTQTLTTYLRGMDGDATASGGTTPVSVKDSPGDSVTDSDWLAGQVLETDTYTAAGGTVDAKVVNGPWTFTTTGTEALPGGLPALTARMQATASTRSLSLLASGGWRTTQTDTTYNADDEAAQVDAKGDGTAADPETCTTTSYATSTANPMMESYPDEVSAVTGPCGTTPTAANTVSGTLTYYDGTGNGSLTSMGTLGAITGAPNATGSQVISGYSSAGQPQYQAKDAVTYDAYGRVLSSTDANGNVTSTAYTPAAGALPAKQAVTNPMGWVTTTTLDPARGLALATTDPNGNTTVRGYDALGRVTAVWLAGRAASQTPNYSYAYSVTGTAPSAIATSTLREDSSYSASVQLYDGMLQVRQEQQTPASGAAGRMITDTFYDSHGWTVKTSNPYYDSTSAPDGTLFAADDDQVPGQTVTQHDGQGRVTASQSYSLGHLQWQTSTAYPGAGQTDVTPPKGGTATSTFTDALGQTTATWSYTDSATPTDKAADADVTSYAYTPAGQVATVTDNAGNKWSYAYNLLGQETSQADPDAGTTTFGYDHDGNLTSTTDARGQTLVYGYDALNRETAEYSGSVSIASELASWQYDTLDKGLLTSATSYSGGAAGSAYTQAFTGYTASYQPIGTSTTIPSAEGSLAGTYTTANIYTPNTGLLASTSYSADGGLPAETVRYSYAENGLLSAFGGKSAYLDAVSYAPDGQVQRTTTGPAGGELAITSGYDAATGRLLQTTASPQTGGAALDTTGYTYNPEGDITSVSDAQAGGTTDTQCFGYDNLQQLATAWTDTAGTATAASPSVPGIGGCVSTAPSAATIGGPAPYWESWSFDPLGDRTGETIHNTAGNTADNVTQALSYPGGNGATAASQPSAVTNVATTGPGGTTTTRYDYNAAGDTTSRTSTSTGSSPPAGPSQSFTYTPLDQVQSVTTGTGSTAQSASYTYDAGGNLLIQHDPGTTTLYLDDGAEQLQLSGGTVTGLRTYTEPDGTTIVRSSAGQVSYELGNQQGTNVATVSAANLAETRRYYDPYGNPRGSAPSSWPDNLGFLDQPADTSSGLTLLGVRQYDPVTGRFLDVDPVLEASDTRQMGGYAYAADNPASNADPSGAMVLCGNTPCGDPGGCSIGDNNCGGGGNGGGGGGGGGSEGGCWGPGGEYLCGGNGNGGGGGGGNGGGGGTGTGGSGCWGAGGEWLCAKVKAGKPWHPVPPTPVAGTPPDMAECAAFFGLANCLPAGLANMINGSSFGSWAIRKVGQVTGVTDAINCVKNPSLALCVKATVKLALTAVTIASLGTAAPETTAADGAVDATADATTNTAVDAASGAGSSEAGDVATSTASKGATEAAEDGPGWLAKACASAAVGLVLTCGGQQEVDKDVSPPPAAPISWVMDLVKGETGEPADELGPAAEPYTAGLGPGDLPLSPYLPYILYEP
ncbi:MAG TPA: RHS repeat-associated core domain-containing protein [Streptosporangiaceae bacterium]|jgi:RHS repeat-associated protein